MERTFRQQTATGANKRQPCGNIFDGRTPVVFCLTESRRHVLAPATMWVSLNDVMIKELKYQLGEENVVVK